MVDMEFLQAIADMMDQKLEEKLTPINNRLDRLETQMDRLETRMDDLETQMDRLETRMDGLETHIGNLEARMDSVEIRMDHMESVTQSLQSGQIQIRRDLRLLTEKVDSAYQLALDAWGQSTENRSWLETAAH